MEMPATPVSSAVQDKLQIIGSPDGTDLRNDDRNNDLVVVHTLMKDVDCSSESAASRRASITSPLYEALLLTVICSCQLLTQAGLALSIVPGYILAQSFGIEGQPEKLAWFTAGYSLTIGTFILIAGRLGDVFGHKRFFVFGFAWFAIWSALAGCAVYSGPVLFAFCRAMQGIGPAFLIPNAIAIIAHRYEPGPRLHMAFSLFGATAPGGFLLGAVFSSLLAQRLWWPWAFWIMACTCLTMAVLGFFVVPADTPLEPAPDRDESSIWQRIDLLGSITGVASLVLFNFAWNQGPVVGWSTPYVYIILILGVVTFGLFIFVERTVRHPLIPFGVLKVDSFYTLACVAAGWSSFGIFMFYTLRFLQGLRGLTALQSAAEFSPSAVSGLCAAITTGFLLSRLRASTVMLMSMIAFCMGGILFATMPVNQIYWAQTFVGVVVLPWGMDMSFPAATIILSRAMPKEHQGLAASLVNTFVNYSISIGLGLAATVESQVNNHGMNLLDGYRGALYMGVGLSGLGVVVALAFCIAERFRLREGGNAEKETAA